MPRLAPLALCSALLLAACTPPPASGPAPGSNRWLARMATDSAASADSLAVWTRRGCRNMLGMVNRECVERALYGVLDRSGVAKAMATLDVLAVTEAAVRDESHPLAHGLGIAAYKSPETVATTFAECPNTQISGCYHGVIQGYFLDMARRGTQVGAEQMNGICAPHLNKGLLWGQCVHGLGHGVMALLRNHLPNSLAMCDLLSDPGAREGCYGGAFMENIVAVTHPHATAESHHALLRKPGEAGHGHHGAQAGQATQASHGEHAGHEGMNHAEGGHATAAATPWKPLDASDPLYPCSVVDAKYHHQCYMIQTAAILPLMAGDFAHTAKACSRAPANMVHVCYSSLGRDISAYAGRDPRRAAEMCARAGTEAEPACIRGAAVSLVEVNQKPEDGLALCRLAPAAAQARCYAGVAGTLVINTPDLERREQVCASLDAAHQETCREAAGIRRRTR